MRGVWAFPLALATCIVPLTCAHTHFATPSLIPDIVIGNVKVSDSLGRVSLGTTRAVFFFVLLLFVSYLRNSNRNAVLREGRDFKNFQRRQENQRARVGRE